MAPTMVGNTFASLLRRDDQCYFDAFGNERCINESSGWYRWGRWVVLGVVILVFLLFVSCLCLTSRRRRRRGAQPYYGTGWMSNGPLAPPPYQPPPNYSAHPQPQQESGVYAPQHPKPVYAREEQGYEMGGYQPPPGPPPTK